MGEVSGDLTVILLWAQPERRGTVRAYVKKIFRWCVTVPVSAVAIVALGVAMALIHVTDDIE